MAAATHGSILEVIALPELVKLCDQVCVRVPVSVCV